MSVLAARAILLRHDGSRPVGPPLARSLRPDRVAPGPSLPGGDEASWTSVLIAPVTPAPVDAGMTDEVADAWDAAHALVADARRGGAPPDTYAEPDLLYALPPAVEARAARAVPTPARAGEWIMQWPPMATLVPKPPIDWFLDLSNLRKARETVSASLDPAFRITVAHLDTGYNPKHAGLPRTMLWDAGIDFTVDPPGKSVVDPAMPHPIKSSPGHGTGTVCLLAGGTCRDTGADLGGVPFARVLPVRISDYVWHVWTSVIPKGIQYAIDQGAQVINLCHGGLPTRAWADAVNAAYEAGVVICAATGDNFGGIPYRWVVWPARYPQVIGVAGVTHDHQPYFDTRFGLDTLEGNFGPVEDMGHVIAAYTPNVPWARCRADSDSGQGDYVTDGYDLDGGGTSASTPQVAAAVALYMQHWWPKLKVLPGWQRVEVVRAALKASADRSANDPEHFGVGFLDALAMLSQDPDALAPGVARVSPATFSYAFLVQQPGWPAIPEGSRRMLEIELTHIAHSNGGLWEEINAWQATGAVTADPEFRKLREAVLASREPRASRALRDLMVS